MLFFTAQVSMQLHSSISVQIEQNAVKFKVAPRKHESILNIFFANNQRPPNNLVSTYATVMTDCFVEHSHRLSTISLCLESLRNRTPSNLKLQNSIVKKNDRKMGPAGQQDPVLKHTQAQW